METVLKQFKEVLEVYDINDFYSVNFTKFDIKLQGEYSSEKVVKYRDALSVSPRVGKNGYIEFLSEVEGIELEIVLT